MDLSTDYMNLALDNPLVPSASPLSDDIDNIRRMEDAGAAAIVLPSLFEEQLIQERFELHHHLSHMADSHAEAVTYHPEPSRLQVGPEAYLEHIRHAKEAVAIPVIASLNGTSRGGWTDFARNMQDAGADAIELNVYHVPTNPDTPGTEVERQCIDVLKCVKSAVTVPVAVKLSPYFSAMANMARQLEQAGADALVLFNRFYQPDIDLENLEIKPNVLLSTPQALRLPLLWVGVLYGRVRVSLAATGGIHEATDVLKMLMAGANVTMVLSTLLMNGIDQIGKMKKELVEWMEEHEYESVRQMQGSMSQMHCEDPSAFERAQYTKAISSIPPALLGNPIQSQL